MAVQDQQPLAGEETQPQEERHRWLAHVLRQSSPGFQVRLLENVGGVDPPLQPLVEAQGHHAPQPIGVPREQLAPPPGVSRGRQPEEVIRLARVLCHALSHAHYN
jgi:hypothetical protein